MNYGIIRYVLGRILLVESVLLCPSLLVGLYYQETIQTLGSFLITIAALLATGLIVGSRKPAQKSFYALEGFVIVALAWLLMSVFGAMPFILSGSVRSPFDAFFETASGFTTTGASIIRDVEALPRSIMFWRSLTHLIGGMGVLVFALAVMPRVESEAVHIMKAEVPGPTFGKMLARVRNSARILYLIYLAMTTALVVALVICGMPLFDSFLHAFGAAGTGGFSLKNTSIGHYENASIEIILALAMVLFGVNFFVYYLILIRQFRSAFKNEELRWYLGIIAAAVIIIGLFVWPIYGSLPRLLRDVFFTVSSIITTTGYSTVDFNTWPLGAHIILLLLMFCGAMAGSTGGGLKVSRVAIYIKTSIQEISRAVNPNRRMAVRFEGKTVDAPVQRNVSSYFITYMLVFSFILLVTSIDSPNFITAFSAVAATFNNIGPGMGLVGPMSNYADFSNLTKLVLSLGMIAGRLEIYPVLVLLSPRTWTKV
jgi:trk system potassium uptake protein